MPADQGAPFSGEQIVTITVAGNATLFAPGTRSRVWRDAEGRLRIEESKSPIVQICDPVEGACYVLDSREMVAHRMKYTPREIRMIDPTDSREEKRRLEELGITGESIGTQPIGGVNAKGYSFKLALIHETREMWFAPVLGLVIRSVATDGPTKTITELVNLSLENSAPALFKVPSGYTVREETSPFTIALAPDIPR